MASGLQPQMKSLNITHGQKMLMHTRHVFVVCEKVRGCILQLVRSMGGVKWGKGVTCSTLETKTI